jgi:transcriptional regulator with XRE-family HTH domain
MSERDESDSTTGAHADHSPGDATPPRGKEKKGRRRPAETERASSGTGTGWPAPVTLGNRIQRVRQRLGLSVRDLADRAGVNKDTVVKLERGQTPSYRTLVRVCDALEISVVQLLRPEAEAGEEAVVSLHLRQSEQRVPRPLVELDPDSPETVRYREARQRELIAADEKVLLSWLSCRLPGGKLNAWILELRGETDTSTHPGEEFLFCLRGTARLTVAGRIYTLREGDAATFWCAEPHTYAPSEEAMAAGDLPVLLLSVWISAYDTARK